MLRLSCFLRIFIVRSSGIPNAIYFSRRVQTFERQSVQVNQLYEKGKWALDCRVMGCSVSTLSSCQIMNWLVKFSFSAVGKKIVMATTGIFLLTFLFVHLVGNLQLLKDDGGRAFNEYAFFMGTNPVIQSVSKINFILISVHIIWAIILTKLNREARGPVAYKKVVHSSPSWSSRHMFILGMIVFLFLFFHLRHFWVETHFGNMSAVVYDGKLTPDLYALVFSWFFKVWYVSFYARSMLILSIHLWHGLPSVFQTLGLNHYKYNLGIMIIGKSMALLIPGMFALIPILMYLRTL